MIVMVIMIAAELKPHRTRRSGTVDIRVELVRIGTTFDTVADLVIGGHGPVHETDRGTFIEMP